MSKYLLGLIVAIWSALFFLTISYDKVAPSVDSTVIIADSDFSPWSKHATGFFVEDDVIITAKHVYEDLDGKNLKVKTRNGEIIRARDIVALPYHDIAIIKLKKKPHEKTWGNFNIGCKRAGAGTTLLAFGNPLFMRWGVFKLSVVGGNWVSHNQLNFPEHLNDTILVQGPINQGISGGPVTMETNTFDAIGVANALMAGGATFQNNPVISGIATYVSFEKVCPYLKNAVKAFKEL